MKFSDYINEEYDVFYEIRDILIKNCKLFLKEFGKPYVAGKYIWRGIMDPFGNNDYIIKNARTNRKPRFIDVELHKELSRVSKKLWGWDMRTEGVFTGSNDIANRFGKPGVFFPFGSYKYVYSKEYEDAYSEYNMFDIKYKNEIVNKIENIYKNDYKTSGLPNELRKKSSFEAIFKCDKYMIVKHFNLRRAIYEALKELKIIKG